LCATRGYAQRDHFDFADAGGWRESLKTSMKRKISVILAADVAGYSSLVSDDEEETLRQLAKCRALFADLTNRGGGRIFNTAGDAIFAEFASAVNAVRCAIDIQEQMRARNSTYPPNRQMVFRIGITIGDVVERDDDLLGDGVNIAARIQALAPPGGVCISRSTYENVARKILVKFSDLGLRQVKNIPDPVHVYQLDAPPTEKAGRQPSTAVKDKVSSGSRISMLLLGTAVFLAPLITGIAYQLAQHSGREEGVSIVRASVEKSTTKTSSSAQDERTLRPKMTFSDCGSCPEMVVVPAGEFVMGSNKDDIEAGVAVGNEGPQRRVAINRHLAVSRFEVTRDQFEAFVSASGHKIGDKCWTLEGNEPEERAGRSFRNPGYAQTGTHPAVCVSWGDTKAYVEWLSKTSGKLYRLLSEPEWEYIARAGTTARYHFGNDEADLCKFANGADQSARSARLPASWDYLRCTDGHIYTAVVGSFKANDFGVFDALGNVWEWVEDCYAEDLSTTPADGSARSTGDCRSRAVRGGSWSGTARTLRAAIRSKATAEDRYDDVGFRVARALPP
jgi:formylglycine-generating enzyme required for sulfatase activity/class 3 adenylate cyclase